MPNDEHAMLWSGPRAGIEGVKEFFELQQVYALAELRAALDEATRHGEVFLDFKAEHMATETYNKLSKIRCVVLNPFTLCRIETFGSASSSPQNRKNT